MRIILIVATSACLAIGGRSIRIHETEKVKHIDINLLLLSLRLCLVIQLIRLILA